MPIHAHVPTFVEINPIGSATHKVSPTGPGGLPLPNYYVCEKHARELYEGE